MPEFAAGETEPYQYVFIGGTAAINLVHSGIKGERNEFRLGAPMHAIHAQVSCVLTLLVVSATVSGGSARPHAQE